MKNELEKQQAQTKAAYIAGRDAIVKKLGKDASNERVLSVVELMAHLLLTDNYTLTTALALHNLEFFNKQLTDMIEESQKDVSAKDCGLLM